MEGEAMNPDGIKPSLATIIICKSCECTIHEHSGDKPKGYKKSIALDLCFDCVNGFYNKQPKLPGDMA